MRRNADIAFAVIFFVCFSFIVKPVNADYRAKVLGASTTNIQMPPTAEGPGLVLPDSPLFFMDQFKQSVRLFLAFTPEEKAKVHANIAGERMAELRFMLAKNNKEAARTALLGVSDNLSSAAKDLDSAKFSGRDVKNLAKEINQDIKSKQQTMDLLESQTTGEMKAQVGAASESLFAAKVRVEESLPQDELDNEIQDDLLRQANRRVLSVSSLSDELKSDIEELNIQASQAAQNSLNRREEAIKRAIEQKNDSLRKMEERLLALEKKKQEQLLMLQFSSAAEVAEIVKRAQEAAFRYNYLKDKSNEIKNQSTTSTPTPVAVES
ncbi:MAG: DUF5667 domain-containing protein [Candidatus Levybacteria bacterium]|nr:DUF5667 domain-containing protein [Candidatus Levybacteria bacterium]